MKFNSRDLFSKGSILKQSNFLRQPKKYTKIANKNETSTTRLFYSFNPIHLTRFVLKYITRYVYNMVKDRQMEPRAIESLPASSNFSVQGLDSICIEENVKEERLIYSDGKNVFRDHIFRSFLQPILRSSGIYKSPMGDQPSTTMCPVCVKFIHDFGIYTNIISRQRLTKVKASMKHYGKKPEFRMCPCMKCFNNRPKTRAFTKCMGRKDMATISKMPLDSTYSKISSLITIDPQGRKKNLNNELRDNSSLSSFKLRKSTRIKVGLRVKNKLLKNRSIKSTNYLNKKKDLTRK